VFGFWADISDPHYYTDPATMTRVCTRQALWAIVADANKDVAGSGKDGLFLHGYLYTGIDDLVAGTLAPTTFVYASSPDAAVSTPTLCTSSTASEKGRPRR